MDPKQFQLNCQQSPPDERDYQISYLTPLEGVFPEEFLIPYLHEIKNQGSVGSCVAHACTYTREILEEKQNGVYAKFSPGFVYGMREDTDYQGEGMYPRQALAELLHYGICDFTLFPYNETYAQLKPLIEQQRVTLAKNAFPHRISAYVSLNTVEEVKTAIMRLGPVLIGIPVYESFYRVQSDGLVPIPQESEKFYGGHAMAIVGWTKNNHWIVLNSWSQGWGDHGICYMPFDYPIWEKWSITDNIKGGEDMSVPYDRKIQAIVIHHMGDGKPPEETILNRWNPYGYQYPEYDFGIEADGTVRVGRPLNIIGAHCQSDIPPFSERGDNWWNKNSIGIGLAGDFTLYAMQWAQYEALLKLVRELMAKYNVSEIRAHKEVTRTACPGNWDFEAFKKDLEGTKVFENLVCYDWYDDGAAKLLADKLHAPVVHIDNVTDELWACAKKKYKVGGGAFRDAQVISGADRFATMQAVLNL